MGKAQLSVYILVGIIILAVAIFAVRTYQSRISTEEVLPTELQPAKEYLQHCLRDSLDRAVREVALQGGYAELPEQYLLYQVPYVGETPFAYYLYEQQTIVPSTVQVSQSIGVMTAEELRLCVDEQPLIGYNFSLPDQLNVRIEMGDADIQAKLTVPIQITGEQSRLRIAALAAMVPLPIGAMHTIAQQITDMQAEDTTSWCITCLSDLASPAIAIEPDFLAGDGNTIILYRLIEREAEIPLIFQFAHRLPYQQPEMPLELPELDTLTARVGQPFVYQFPTWESQVLYADDSPLFAIDPFTGRIAFSPAAEDVGTYVTTITMKAPSGDFAQEMFMLEVKP